MRAGQGGPTEFGEGGYGKEARVKALARRRAPGGTFRNSGW